jgi:hypothetical protein
LKTSFYKLFFCKFDFCLGSKYQTTYNEIEHNSEQKLTDSAKSVDWSDENDKTNKGK